MPTATLTVPALADHARTTRLVAGAAARRAGVDPEALDDVRLAVAEALAQAVLRAGQNPDGYVRVSMTDDADFFEISVTDGQEIEATDEAAGLSLSLIRALAPHARITGQGPDHHLVLRWPIVA